MGGADKKLKEDALYNGENKVEPEIPKQVKGKKNFLVTYAMTLLAVAFVLVLLSYFNEIRANQAEIADLKEEKEQFSLSAMQDIQSLEDENKGLSELTETLRSENDELKKRIATLEEQVKKLDALYTEAKESLRLSASEQELLEARQIAIEKLLRISDLYADRKFSYSAYEISELEAGNSNYINELFQDANVGEMTSELIFRYADIREWLNERGYLDPEKIDKWKTENKISDTGN